MRKYASILLLVLLFSKSLYSIDLHSKLDPEGYIITNIAPLKTNGATDCQYFLVETLDNKFFVKMGEKVNREIENLIFLSNHGVKFIPKIFPGTSVASSFLVEEFFEKNDYGYNIVNQFHANHVDENTFLNFQAKAFDLLKEFYKLRVPIEGNSSTVFDKRAAQRLEDLLKEQDVIYISKDILGTETGISLRDMLHLPIRFSQSVINVECQSVVEMTTTFVAMMKRIPKIPHKILHGDFHPPNITQDNIGGLHPVDLSDVMYDEDPSWDLGKWLNHINRLYKVVAKRSSNYSDQEIIFDISQDNLLIVEDRSIKNPALERINLEAVIYFSKMIDAPSDLVSVRAAAAEFIVNISTFKRHLNRFPFSTKAVFVCIIESYLQFQKKFHDYAETHPEY